MFVVDNAMLTDAVLQFPPGQVRYKCKGLVFWVLDIIAVIVSVAFYS